MENFSDLSVRINTSYVLAHGFPMAEPEVDWARGKYSHLKVLSILQQEMDQDQGLQKKGEEVGPRTRSWPPKAETAG